jgi:molybdopterin synthase catalytic subunit/molybdopterin converting factor small subunit
MSGGGPAAPDGAGGAGAAGGPDDAMDGAAGGTIRVRVRLFARLRELAGGREVSLELPAGSVVEDAWRALAAERPAVAPMRPHTRFAVNGRYAAADAPLPDDAELACIPPISGGSGDGPGDGAVASGTGSEPVASPRELRILETRDEPFDASIIADLAARLATEEDGAVVGFIGRTRITAGDPAPGEEAEAARFVGLPVDALEYEALEPLVLRVLAEIADEAEARFGVRRLAIVHRTGRVPLGEAAVAIVAVAPHRAEAFDAAEYAMDETKARAPIWKAEVHAGGHVWVGAPARSGPDAPDGKARADGAAPPTAEERS